MSRTAREDLERACSAGAKLSAAKLAELQGDMSDAELQDRSGVNRSTLHRLRAGQNSPRSATIEALARALKCKPLDLLQASPAQELAETKRQLAAVEAKLELARGALR